MIDRIVASSSILLCLMCDKWGPIVVKTAKSPGEHTRDWIELFFRTPAGRALVYQLAFAVILNTTYGACICLAMIVGIAISNLSFKYILIPIHAKENRSLTKGKQQQNDSSTTNGNRKSSLTVNQQQKPAVFLKKINLIQTILVCLSCLTTIWCYTNNLIVATILSAMVARGSGNSKFSDRKELFIVASYLLATAATNNYFNNLLNISGGAMIFCIYYLDSRKN